MIYNTSGRQMYNKNDKLEYRYRVKKKDTTDLSQNLERETYVSIINDNHWWFCQNNNFGVCLYQHPFNLA